jgi:hypothetical protein
MRSMGEPPSTVPVENAEAMGFEFPTTEATDLMIWGLEQLVADFVRAVMARRYPLTAEVLGKAYGLAPRQAQTVVSRARSDSIPPEGRLCLEVLRRMAAGTIPSIRGIPRTRWTRWLIAAVAGYDRDDWARDLPDLTPAERRALPVWHAAFKRDARECGWLDARADDATPDR